MSDPAHFWGGYRWWLARTGVCSMLMFVLCSRLAGNAVYPHESGFFTEVWQTEDGLPYSAVTAVVQTDDGYLWLGTYNGLVRFDGVQFRVFDELNTAGLPARRVTALYQDGTGVLWIGFESGHLVRYMRGRFEQVQLPGEWGSAKIYGLAQDRTGRLWVIGADGQLCSLKDRRVVWPESGSAQGVVLYSGGCGRPLLICRNGIASEVDASAVSRLDWVPSSYVQGICNSADGGVWLVADGTVSKWTNGTRACEFGPAPWGYVPLTLLAETTHGVLVAGTADAGLYMLAGDGQWFNLNRTNGLGHDWVRAFAEDTEGNYWVGTGGGLVVVRRARLRVLNPPDQWQGRPLLTVCQSSDGSVWAGTEGAGLYRYDGRCWVRFGPESGLSNQYVWSVVEDSSGRLWVSTWGAGVYWLRQGRFEPVPGLTEFHYPVAALQPVADGSMLIGTGAGLLLWRTNASCAWLPSGPAGALGDVRTLAVAPDGTLWVGTYGNGLFKITGHAVTRFTKADGLSSDYINTVCVEQDSTVWVGTLGGGLCRFKHGRFVVISERHGLPNNTICSIQVDGEGNFWLGSFAGVIRCSRGDLTRCADGVTNRVECMLLGRDDGMPSVECSGGVHPAGCVTATGTLLFPTRAGLVEVDPARLWTNLKPPPVWIDEVLADGKRVWEAGGSAPELVLGPGAGRLEFVFTALSFYAPRKVRFRYKLEGLDGEWVDGGAKRSASYGYVPPGMYRFTVAACNNDGVWGQSRNFVELRVLPWFWQTWQFKVLVGAVVALGAGGIVWIQTHRRMKRKLEQLERQRMLEHERARIARDMHDELGASLTRIAILCQNLKELVPNDTAGAQVLDAIYNTARESTKAMDEIVWAVSPRHDSMDSLVSYLEKYALEFLRGSGIKCRLDLPLELPPTPVTTEVRHNLFLACKEALTNVVKHARATEVSIALEFNPDGFEFVIRDNGCGFDPGEVERGLGVDRAGCMHSGNGLKSMAQRMAEIGGMCTVRSAPGQGTEVRFRVHLPRH